MAYWLLANYEGSGLAKLTIAWGLLSYASSFEQRSCDLLRGNLFRGMFTCSILLKLLFFLSWDHFLGRYSLNSFRVPVYAEYTFF